ncbi:MAG: hypothetical protein AAF328_07840 [Planctomycetota bacterium]
MSLTRYECEVLIVGFAATHAHVLAKFTMEKPAFNERGLPATSAMNDPIVHLIGKAKQWSAKR